MDKEQIKNRLKERGYSLFHEYNDSPNEEFPDHNHNQEQIIFILNGGMEVKMDGKNYILKPGDELVFPEKMIHSAKVGHHECEYIDAEKE